MDVNIEQRNTWISLGVIAGFAVVLAFFRTWKWFGRSGKDVIDLPTIGKFFFITIGLVGTVLLLVVSGVCVYWLLRFKKLFNVEEFDVTADFSNTLKILLIVAFILKTLDILHLIVRQSNIEIFFIDWERPKGGKNDSVSVWRSYFVANEFNEIQTFRRINVPFQMFFILFFVHVLDFQHIALRQPEIELFSTPINCTYEYDPMFRTGLGFLVFLGTGIVQYVIFALIFQRLFEDKILNFIDLCSVSNISVFILDQTLHGFYLHGRSPHGLTDVNIKEILVNFYREETGLSGKRGLQTNADEQLFIMKINRTFRRQYELLYQNYNNFQGVRRNRDEHERYTDMLQQSYQNLNGFLCAFIDQSISGHQYFIRERFFLEKLLAYEFNVRAPSTRADFNDNLFFIDRDRTFTELLFYGEERSLFFWNMSTFLFIDFLSKNFILAAILTYLINRIGVSLRNSFGRRNLSRKTLIPKNFLI